MKIAIVEHDKEIQGMILYIAAVKKWKVSVYPSAKAFSNVCLTSFDAIIADAELPITHGARLLRTISKKTNASLILACSQKCYSKKGKNCDYCSGENIIIVDRYDYNGILHALDLVEIKSKLKVDTNILSSVVLAIYEKIKGATNSELRDVKAKIQTIN